MFEIFLASFFANVIAFVLVSSAALYMVDRKIKAAEKQLAYEMQQAQQVLQIFQPKQIDDDFPTPRGGSN